MKILLIGGTGFLGQYLCQQWLPLDYHITVVSRDVTSKTVAKPVDLISWDELMDRGVDCLRLFSVVINLAGESMASARWTAKQKAVITASRVDTTQKIARLCALLGPQSPLLINASGVSIYGPQSNQGPALPEPCTELNAVCTDPHQFMATLACAWEQACQVAVDAGVRVICARMGMVLGHGGALPAMLQPVRWWLGGVVAGGMQPMSWVAIDDVRAAFEFMITHGELHGAINVVSPGCVNHRIFMKMLGKLLKRPIWLPLPAWLMRLCLGPMADELLINGQHVYPQRLHDAGFRFQYDDLKSALRAAISS